MNLEMNILKALAIIAMVIGHSRGPLVGNVYLYHMALFIFVSGYFYKDFYSENPKKLIIKRFKSLYIPFLKFNAFILIAKVIILDNIIMNYGNGIKADLISGIKSLILFNSTDPLISAFWFLKNLFYINIIFVFISYIAYRISNKFNNFHMEKLRAIGVGVIFVSFFYLSQKGLLQNGEISYISRALILNVFFYFGYLYKKNEERFKSLFNFYFFIVAVLYIMIASKYDYFDVYYFYFVNIPFFLISSFIGIYANIYLSKFLVKIKFINKALDYIGQNSLWILCYHLIMFKIAIFIKIKLWNLNSSVIWEFPTYVNGEWDWILDTLLGIILPIILCYGFKKGINKIKPYLKRDRITINN